MTFKTWDEMTQREQLESSLWDAYKDAHGIRPRHVDFASMTMEQLEAMMSDLIDTMNENDKREGEEQADAALKVEATIAGLIKQGAGDRATAIRWLHDAHQTDGDDDYLCYQLGLKYSYFKTCGHAFPCTCHEKTA